MFTFLTLTRRTIAGLWRSHGDRAPTQELNLKRPLRVLAWDERGTTKVGYEDPTALVGGYRLEALQGRLERMRALLAELVAEAAA